MHYYRLIRTIFFPSFYFQCISGLVLSRNFVVTYETYYKRTLELIIEFRIHERHDLFSFNLPILYPWQISAILSCQFLLPFLVPYKIQYPVLVLMHILMPSLMHFSIFLLLPFLYIVHSKCHTLHTCFCIIRTNISRAAAMTITKTVKNFWHCKGHKLSKDTCGAQWNIPPFYTTILPLTWWIICFHCNFWCNAKKQSVIVEFIYR